MHSSQQGDEPYAKLEGVGKRYGEVQALRDVSMQVCPGEVLAVLGPNGAGKTTAVNLMLGLLKPSEGNVRLFGGDPQSVGNRVRVGAMLQLSGVPDALTVKDHIELFSSYYANPLDVRETLELTGLTGLEVRQYGKLSGGQKQRLHLALALCGNPDLLFLDEPTTGLDVASRRALWEAVRNFIGGGRSVVLTTHYLEEADALADRVIVIDHGRIIAEGTPAAIKSRTAGRRVRCVTTLPSDTVRRMTGVTSVKRDGNVTEILATEAEPVVLELLTQDPELRDLEVTGAGLEDAFLALTGGEEPAREQVGG